MSESFFRFLLPDPPYVFDPNTVTMETLPPVQIRVQHEALNLDVFLDDSRLIGDLFEYWFPKENRSTDVDAILTYLANTNPIQLCDQHVGLEIGLIITPTRQSSLLIIHGTHNFDREEWHEPFDMPVWEETTPHIWSWSLANKEPEDYDERLALTMIPKIDLPYVQASLLVSGQNPSFDNACLLMRYMHDQVKTIFRTTSPQWLEERKKENEKAFYRYINEYKEQYIFEIVYKVIEENIVLTDYHMQLEDRPLPESLKGKIHEGYDE